MENKFKPLFGIKDVRSAWKPRYGPKENHVLNTKGDMDNGNEGFENAIAALFNGYISNVMALDPGMIQLANSGAIFTASE
jgi:hypothetical protein